LAVGSANSLSQALIVELEAKKGDRLDVIAIAAAKLFVLLIQYAMGQELGAGTTAVLK